MERQIYVIGSMSMDLVVATSIVPGKGETVLGESFLPHRVVKVPTSRSICTFRTRCTYDWSYWQRYVWGRHFPKFKNNQINVEHVKPTEGPSGTAHITLVDNDNSIIVVPSANNEVTPDYVQEALASTQPGDIVLLQQEIPAETVETAVKYCYEHDVISILNPAPYREISDDVLEQVTYLTPNETESENMFEGDVDGALERYPDKLIVTLGELGAVYHNGLEQVEIKGFKREVKDTTGAGDTFNGALAVGLQKGYDLAEAVTFANLA